MMKLPVGSCQLPLKEGGGSVLKDPGFLTGN
jgi:hypothetical protein